MGRGKARVSSLFIIFVELLVEALVYLKEFSLSWVSLGSLEASVESTFPTFIRESESVVTMGEERSTGVPRLDMYSESESSRSVFLGEPGALPSGSFFRRGLIFMGTRAISMASILVSCAFGCARSRLVMVLCVCTSRRSRALYVSLVLSCVRFRSARENPPASSPPSPRTWLPWLAKIPSWRVIPEDHLQEEKGVSGTVYPRFVRLCVGLY